MTTYYLSSKSGSDTNSGTSANQAWSSFSKLSGKLKAGDTVLLERGSDFEQTLNLNKVYGTEKSPITFSSYGTGAAPVFSSDTDRGIVATNSNYLIFENLAVQDTAGNGFYGWNANNIVLRNMTFDNVGGTYNLGAVNMTKSSNILFQNNTVTNSHGDGIYMTLMNNVVVVDSAFKNATGSTADNIQISGSNTLIAGNIIVIDENSDTTKGNLVFQGENLYAHDNYMQGGSFGASISANNVIIQNNVILDHTKYNWSSNLMITDQITGDTAKDITITGNNFYNAYRDINIDGKNTSAANMTIYNLEISNNEFHDWLLAPVAFNGVNANGVLENNISDKNGNFVYSASSNTGNLAVSDNVYVPETVASRPAAPPLLEPKIITVVASGSQFEGFAPLMQLLVNGIVVEQREVTALKANNQTQNFTFQIKSFGEDDIFSIKFVNDKFDLATGEDRNLYIHSVAIEGESLNLKNADVLGKIFYLKKEGNAMFYSSNAEAVFTSDDVPQHVLTKPVVTASPLPRLEDILSSDEHDIYYGGENHNIGASSQNTFGTGFSDLTSSLEDLHQALNTNIV